MWTWDTCLHRSGGAQEKEDGDGDDDPNGEDDVDADDDGCVVLESSTVGSKQPSSKQAVSRKR